MPKDSFQVSETLSLSDLKPDARIHFIAVAGVAMSQLAIQLAERGFKVSGSDKAFYPPSGDFLAESKVEIIEGYCADNIQPDFDLVVIGNAVPYSNPEVQKVEKLGLPYTLFPKLLGEFLLTGAEHSLVAAGTHGKSTTSAMMSYVLQELGEEPSYFVGGRVPQLNFALKKDAGTAAVFEGDEYDSCFFAKYSKFHFYHPNRLIVSSLEFDHADIFSSLDDIKSEFRKLFKSMPEDGHVFLCADYPELLSLATELEEEGRLKVVRYGVSELADVRLAYARPESTILLNGKSFPFRPKLLGRYNALNACSVFLALTSIGLDPEKVLAQIESFSGVDRRQQILLETDKLVLIEDFAHHPTAVSETLEAVREEFLDSEIVAVFEPRSTTSRKSQFADDYLKSLSIADRVFVKSVTLRELDNPDDILNTEKLCIDLSKRVPAKAFDSVEQFLSQVAELEPQSKQRVFLLMSNGSFDGLPRRFAEFLS